MVTPFETCGATGAVLLLNLFDPQIATFRLFLEAVKNASLPFLVVGNKLDLVSKETVAKVQAELGQEFPVMSLLTGENVPSVIEEIERRFPQGSRIIVLGIFNAGKNEPYRAAYWESPENWGSSGNNAGIRGARVEWQGAH